MENDLNNKSVDELRVLAKAKGLKGYSRCKRENLLCMLKESEKPKVIEEKAGGNQPSQNTNNVPIEKKTRDQMKWELSLLGFKGLTTMNKSQLTELYNLRETKTPDEMKKKRQPSTWETAIQEWAKQNNSKQVIFKKGTEQYDQVVKINDRLKSQKEAVKNGKAKFEEKPTIIQNTQQETFKKPRKKKSESTQVQSVN
jgi:hypothetical protein